MALNAVGEAVEQPYHGGLVIWRRNTGNAANGSLMRNGVVPALFYQEDQEIEALDVTVLHSIITHYGPLPVLTCALHTLLIRDALLNPSSATRPPTMEDIKQLVQVRWKRWKESSTNEPAKEWLRNIGKKELELQEQKLLSELNGFESFDPFRCDYRGCSGYCVLGLKIALWALYWSFREDHPPLAEWLPEWPFEKHGFETLMWVVLIGADADTNGAIAGPLLAAYHPDIPSTLQKGLLVKPLLEQYIQ
ncbi:ADP-ribosylglycohydrolase family protein [Balamuthia mandrillaris]